MPPYCWRFYGCSFVPPECGRLALYESVAPCMFVAQSSARFSPSFHFLQVCPLVRRRRDSVFPSLYRPIPLYLRVGRSGPVRTADLWDHILPICLFGRSSFHDLGMLIMTSKFPPFSQLMVCGPVGLLCGAVAIGSFRSHRKVAAHLLETVRELKKSR
jgi:hypothetical protein